MPSSTEPSTMASAAPPPARPAPVLSLRCPPPQRSTRVSPTTKASAPSRTHSDTWPTVDVSSASSTSSKATDPMSSPAPRAMTTAMTRWLGRVAYATTAPTSSAAAPSAPHPKAAITSRSRRAGALPEVDVALDRVPVDLGELVVVEVEPLERAQAVVELLDAAGADEHGRDAVVAQRPGQRELRQRLAAPLRHLVERPDAGQVVLGELLLRQRAAPRHPRSLGDPAEVAVGEQALG